jgi:hypothetical protein
LAEPSTANLPATGFITEVNGADWLWTGSRQVRAGEPGRTFVNVRWFGAVGDGTTDDRRSIQEAIEAVRALGGGKVYLPSSSGGYNVTHPVYLQSKVHLCGDGETSLIVNKTTNVNDFPKTCLAIGSFAYEDDNDYSSSTRLLNAVTSGANEVEYVGDILTGITVGSIVIVRSNQSVSQSKTWDYIQINEVIAASGRIVTLKYPIQRTMSTASLVLPGQAAGDPFLESQTIQTPRYIVVKARVSDIGFHSKNGSWCVRYGMFETHIENITVLKSWHGMMGNAMAYSSWRGVRGVFSRRAIEVAVGSSDSIIDDVELTYQKEEAAAELDYLLSIYGLSRNMRIANVRVFVHSSPNTLGPNLNAIELDGEDNVVENCTIYAPPLPVYGISVSAADHFTYARRLEFRNNLIVAGSAIDLFARVAAPLPPDQNGPGATIEDVVFRGNRFLGSPPVAGIRVMGGSRVQVLDNFVDSGDLEVQGNGSCIVDGNFLRNGVLVRSGAVQMLAENNRTPSAVSLANLALQDIGVGTKTNTVLASWRTVTVPAGALRVGDVLELEWFGEVIGTSAGKEINFLVGTTVVNAISVSAAAVGLVQGLLVVSVPSLTVQRCHGRVLSPSSSWSSEFRTTILNLSTSDLALALQGRVLATGSSVRIDLVNFRVRRLGEIS